VLAADGASADRAALVTEMTRRLAHRGPDDEGVASGDGWAVGMRRLAVQDTSHAGHQPMSRDGLTLVYNGEVYNFRELRRELTRAGYAFESGSDTEVVLAALHRWGTDALRRFNGMFALALIDPARRRALLARDRFGKKPLFVAELPGRVAFASELKAIELAAGADGLAISRAALAEYLRLGYVPTPRSIWTGVSKVPAASWLEIDLDRPAAGPAREFWRLPDPADEAPASPEEVLDAVREAVRARLVADVPVGAFLSGGIDSSLVVACMVEAASDVRTFSIGFDDPRYDEAPQARAIASHLGTRHTERRLERAHVAELLPRFAEAYDEPFADSSAFPTMAVAELAREDVTVALSGDGGDELFGGYTRYRLARISRLAAAMPDPLGRACTHVPGRLTPARRARLLGRLAEVGDEAAVYRQLLSVWPYRELRELLPGAEDEAGFTGYRQAGAGPVERMMRTDARTYLVDDILQKVDRASMAVSLEARCPLLDPSVVAVGLRSARAAEAEPGRKALLRETLRRVLPPELVDRPKKGFSLPMNDWLRDELRPLVEDLVVSGTSDLYDREVARGVAEGHLAGRVDAGPQVWSLLALELWHARWHAEGRETAAAAGGRAGR
jgi:asparagine synthase (glutamine-hydrolysing)